MRKDARQEIVRVVVSDCLQHKAGHGIGHDHHREGLSFTSSEPIETAYQSGDQKRVHYAQGLPRVMNQIALQALIRAAISGKNAINADFLKQHVLTHSLFDHNLDHQQSS